MIDQEKVVKGLECCIKFPNEFGDCFGGDCPYRPRVDCHKELLRDAIALLKAPEPKPPIVHENAYGTKFYYCPKCQRVEFGFKKPKYCDNCGQAVKWDE